MRKIIVFNMVSLDGYFADSNGNIGWHTVDDEFNDYAISTFDGLDTILFGRETYQLFESHWPAALTDPNTSDKDRVIANMINNASKVVLTKTLDTVPWKNSRIMRDITLEEITELKSAPGKDIVIYGSGSVVNQLTSIRQIDEYRLMVAPVILGKGRQMFDDVPQTDLQLKSARTFEGTGNVLLTYTPAQ